MCVFRAVKGGPQIGMFWVTANADWARSGCYSTPQDSIKELMNCILRVIGQENGGPMWTAAVIEAS